MSIALWPVSVICVDFLLMYVLLNKTILYLQMLKSHDRALCGVDKVVRFRPSAIREGGGLTIKYCSLAFQYSMTINIL